MKIFKSNPIQSNPIRKLCLSIALIGTAMVGQTAWACEKPNVSGYQQIGCLSEGLAYVITQDEKVGYVDGAGQLVIPATYKELGGYIRDRMNFSEGLAVVKKTDKDEVVFIDKTGRVVFDHQYYTATSFENGLAKVSRSSFGDNWNIIDKTGKSILKSHGRIESIKMYGPIAYIEASDSIDWGFQKSLTNYYYAVNTGKFYNYSGKDFKENRIFVADFDGNYGFLDEAGKEIIPLIYQHAYTFSDGLAGVKKNGKYGFVDTNGKTIVDFKYDDINSFENGKARVWIDDDKTPRSFYIDKTGKTLTTRTSLAEFRKKLEQGDDVYYKTNDDSGEGMIFEIKGNLVQVQTKESQCSQRDYKGNCQNYIENQVGKWVKKSEVYPTNHFD